MLRQVQYLANSLYKLAWKIYIYVGAQVCLVNVLRLVSSGEYPLAR